MIEKTLKAVVAEGIKALENQATNLRANMDHSVQTLEHYLEHYKALVADLVKLSGEVREGDFFAKVQALKMGELVVQGDRANSAMHMRLQVGYGGEYIQLSGYPSHDEGLAQGRYRIVVMLQKTGDL